MLDTTTGSSMRMDPSRSRSTWLSPNFSSYGSSSRTLRKNFSRTTCRNERKAKA